ncbi:hypothetical protein HF086_007226 [Spodoptera exigua]|uniref:Uncharacterized protein n=1 Tax=Spodoptera exigua TaxID=7107 RepID=A0A922SLP9_SPOEX|nr:hypothetical protein HF086_007226 [Spodoptera exigua]
MITSAWCGVAGAEGAWGGAYWPEPDPRRAWPVPRADQEIPVYIPPKTMPEIPVVYSSQQQTLRDSPKKGFELLSKESTEPPPAPRPPPPPAPKPAQTSKPAESADKKQSSAAAHVHYPADERGDHDDHDGLSEHPPAAMMLLVLGKWLPPPSALGVGGVATEYWVAQLLSTGRTLLGHHHHGCSDAQYGIPAAVLCHEFDAA